MECTVNKPYFYCYSYKLAFFIKSQGISYLLKGNNKNSKCKYYMFAKSNELDDAIKLWNELKISQIDNKIRSGL